MLVLLPFLARGEEPLDPSESLCLDMALLCCPVKPPEGFSLVFLSACSPHQAPTPHLVLC